MKKLPSVAQLLDEFPADRFAVLGVNAFDDHAAFRRGQKNHGVSWPCLFDGPEAPLTEGLGIRSFPTVLLVDPNGVIRAKNPAESELRDAVRSLLE